MRTQNNVQKQGIIGKQRQNKFIIFQDQTFSEY